MLYYAEWDILSLFLSRQYNNVVSIDENALGTPNKLLSQQVIIIILWQN